MRKLVFKVVYLATVMAAGLGMVSCFNSINREGSITLELPERLFSESGDPTSSSGANETEDERTIHIVAALSGNYSDVKSMAIKESALRTVKPLTMTFESVPIGRKVTVNLGVFKENGYDFDWLYSGKSDTILVGYEENIARLSMKTPTPISENETYLTINTDYKNNHSERGSFNLDDDGFYEINMTFGQYELYNDAISIGTWEGDIKKGGTLYLTENLFTKVSVEDEDEYTYLLNGKEEVSIPPRKFTVKIDGDGNFSFTLKNGVKISGSICQ